MLVPYNPLIYVVDDDEDDLELLQNVFAKNFAHCTVRTFDNGSDLLAHLTHQIDGRLPDLIILDLDMPIFSGFELLHYLKQDTDYRSIPIVILSGSQYTEHIDRCYALGSTAYMTKTLDYQQLVSRIRHLRRYWSRTGSLKLTQKQKINFQIEGISFTELSPN